jgi:hypothetical protein
MRSARSRTPTARASARPVSLRIALRRAVVEAPAGRIADAGRLAVAHQGDDAALAQRRPGSRFVGARRTGRHEQDERRDARATRWRRARPGPRPSPQAGDERSP